MLQTPLLITAVSIVRSLAGNLFEKGGRGGIKFLKLV
ncbi:MAG: hypothetical protein ACI8R9_000019 [Paraglaciecola sp.]|jgi:hypothetical protein